MAYNYKILEELNGTFNHLRVAVIKGKAGDFVSNVCNGSMSETRKKYFDYIDTEGTNRFEVTFLNGNKNIPSNNNMCGIVLLEGKGFCSFEWSPDDDSHITEDDIKEYLEYAVSTEEVESYDYSMESGVANIYSPEAGGSETHISDWHNRASFNHVLRVPIMKTGSVSDNCTYLQIQNPLSWDYRQIDIKPNEEFVLEKHCLDEFPDESYFYLHSINIYSYISLDEIL